MQVSSKFPSVNMGASEAFPNSTLRVERSKGIMINEEGNSSSAKGFENHKDSLLNSKDKGKAKMYPEDQKSNAGLPVSSGKWHSIPSISAAWLTDVNPCQNMNSGLGNLKVDDKAEGSIQGFIKEINSLEKEEASNLIEDPSHLSKKIKLMDVDEMLQYWDTHKENGVASKESEVKVAEKQREDQDNLGNDFK